MNAQERSQDWPLFSYTTPSQRIVSGVGVVDHVAEEVAKLGLSRGFLVAGPATARSALYARVRAALGTACVGEYREVQMHAPVMNSEQAATRARTLQVDFLVSVGGGSASDTAKAIAILLAEGGRFESHCTHFTPPDKLTSPDLRQPKLPLLAVPTTASGAEMTPGGGATNPAGAKLLFWDEKLAAKVVFLDPEATNEVPIDVTVSTAMNGLAHCIEGLYSKTKNPFSEVLALEGIRLFVDGLPKLVENPMDHKSRATVQMAAALGGMVISNARTALHHALCHALGGALRLRHGDANSVMLPHAMRFNLDGTWAAQAKVARAMGATDSLDPRVAGAKAADAVSEFGLRVGAPRRLRDLGVVRQDLRAVAVNVLSDRALFFNPKPITTVEPLLQLYEEAW